MIPFILVCVLAVIALVSAWFVTETPPIGRSRPTGWGRERRLVLAAAASATGVATVGLGFDPQRLGVPGSTGSGFGGSAAEAATISSLSTSQRALLGAGWLTSPALRAEDLRGKVVLVNFWTYSCINSLRPLPYLKAWAEKYRDQGLMVVGVHTPEFGFEKDVANVRRAVAAQGVSYPVALDSDYGVWQAFNNNAWPAFYFIGRDGRVRHQQLGEGGYAQAERLIRQLLFEGGGSPLDGSIVAALGQGVQAAPDLRDLRSPETYVGYAQGARFASAGGVRKDIAGEYRAPSALPLNGWSLAGDWTIGPEFATSNGRSGRIAYRFHARDLHLVMSASPQGKPVRFRVTIDGASPGANHGLDVDAEGRGVAQEPRLYQLIRQADAVRDRTFEIEFLDPGARAYVFTFG